MGVESDPREVCTMGDRYLIAFDMDGTLLRPDGTIGARSRQIIAELEARGHYVTIASGRPDRVITPYYRDLGMNGPVVCYNGSKVFKPDDPTFPIYRKLISVDVIQKFLRTFGYERFDTLMAESDTAVYINHPDLTLADFFHPDGMTVKMGDLRELVDEDCYVLIIGMKNHDLDERLVRCAFQFPGIGLRFWGGLESRYSELYFPDSSKTTGLAIAQEYVGLDRDHVIVIGDGDNDVEMLTHFPHSIAMINGEKQVQRRASRISDLDNAHDGAAEAVLKLVNELEGR